MTQTDDLRLALTKAMTPADAYVAQVEAILHDLAANDARLVEPPDEPPDSLCKHVERGYGVCMREATTWAWETEGMTTQWVAKCGVHGPKPPFRVDTPQMASWALRKMGQAQAHAAEAQALYDEEKARLDAFLTSATAQDKRTISFMETHLVGYLRRLRAASESGKDPKSVKLPGGTVSHARSQAVEIVDRDALLAWAIENGYGETWVKRTEEPQVSKIKEYLARDGDGVIQSITDAGESVPGIAVDVRDNWKVNPS